jgi:hypothetical protein
MQTTARSRDRSFLIEFFIFHILSVFQKDKIKVPFIGYCEKSYPAIAKHGQGTGILTTLSTISPSCPRDL